MRRSVDTCMQLIFCAGHDFSDLRAWRRLDYHRAKLPVAGSFESLPKQWLAKMLGRVHTQLSKATWHVSRRPRLSARLTFQVLICHKLFCPNASCLITALTLISWVFFFVFVFFPFSVRFTLTAITYGVYVEYMLSFLCYDKHYPKQLLRTFLGFE